MSLYSNDPHIFTRKELYDLVWSKPMTKVAAELGVSDVALHKVCKKHRVPAPGRGYWAKLAAGKLMADTRAPIDWDEQRAGLGLI